MEMFARRFAGLGSMKSYAISLLAAMLLLAPFAQAQIQFWSDDFEDVGAPSSGTRTPSSEFNCGTPATAYFTRTDVTGVALQNGTYSNIDGSKFWAGEDIG